MLPFCFYGDQITPSSEAKMSVHDLSALRGYGVFDFLPLVKGVPVFWEDYYERFQKSCNYLKLSLSQSSHELKSIIHELVTKNHHQNGYVRLLMTGGYSENGYLPEGNNQLAVFLYPEINYPDTMFSDGAKLISCDYVRSLPEAKTTDYALSITLQEKMKKADAFDVLYTKDGYVSECSRCNIFMVKNEELITPDSHMLLGVTRKKILQIADEIMTVKTRPVRYDELLGADEVFITSTTKGTLGIISIDAATIHEGKVGRTTKLLREKYYAKVKEYTDTHLVL